jgi:tRNA (guanine37-N1)-methyltransferase
MVRSAACSRAPGAWVGILAQIINYFVDTRKSMKVQIITLFPEMFSEVFDHSMLFKAQDLKLLEVSYVNLRDFGVGPRRQVDDTPYGGGDGMLLMIEPLTKAIAHAREQANGPAKVLLMTPRGETYVQSHARELSKEDNLIIVCSRYEGYDERVVDLVDEQISIGNYVLTGGEIPAMIIVDSVVRLIPGVLGGENSAEIESFSDDESQEIEFPQYTRPEVYDGKSVPEILLSGNHGEIDKWRKSQ